MLEGVFRIALLVVLILVINFGLNFSQVYTMELAGQKMMHDLRMKVFSHLQELPISFFDKNPVGRLVTRLTNDIQNVHEMFTSVLINLLKDILLVIGNHHPSPSTQPGARLGLFFCYSPDLCHDPLLQPSSQGCVSGDPFEDCPDEFFF